MDLGISGRTAAVAAGSAGLGFGSAKALADEGVRVAICGRDEQKLDRAVASIGNGCVGFVCDVSTVDGARSFVAQATAALGHIDILVANGGGPKPGTFTSIDLEDYAPAIERSMLATVAMCKDVIPAMQSRGWGRVVAITSSSVRQPIANLILSNSARSGLTSFLKTHAAKGKCAYSGMLLSCYPDAPVADVPPEAAPPRLASERVPSSVRDWLASGD